MVSTCANCGSGLLQLEAWKEGRDGAMTLRLRCPECFVRIVGDFDASQVARLDRAAAAARLELTALYQAVVCENLGQEAALMSRALALDLIGPDDFAARPGHPRHGGRRHDARIQSTRAHQETR